MSHSVPLKRWNLSPNALLSASISVHWSWTRSIESPPAYGRTGMIGDPQVLHAPGPRGLGHFGERGPAVTTVRMAMESTGQVGELDQIRNAPAGAASISPVPHAARGI